MEKLYGLISIVVYGLLALLAVWGAYCVVLTWRRLAAARFKNEETQETFLDEIRKYAANKDWEAASELCDGDRRALVQLTRLAMAQRTLPPSQLRQRIYERMERDAVAEIDYRMSWISTVVKVAPMVGLFGTVIGMMLSFANLSAGGQVDSQRMAEDIGFALVTTACGLGIAVPLVLCTAMLYARIRRFEELVAAGIEDIVRIVGGNR